MAALSSKLGAGVPTIGLLANKGRILAVGAVNLKVGRYNANLTAGIRGKYGGRKLVNRDPDKHHGWDSIRILTYGVHHGKENHIQNPGKLHGKENHNQDPGKHRGKENHNQDPGKHRGKENHNQDPDKHLGKEN